MNRRYGGMLRPEPLRERLVGGSVAVAMRPMNGPAEQGGPVPVPRPPFGDAVLGLVLGVSNPVAVVFYVALFPDVVDVARVDVFGV